MLSILEEYRGVRSKLKHSFLQIVIIHLSLHISLYKIILILKDSYTRLVNPLDTDLLPCSHVDNHCSLEDIVKE
jgi:hypothetical protein